MTDKEALRFIKRNYELLLKASECITNKELTDIEQKAFEIVETSLDGIQLFKNALTLKEHPDKQCIKFEPGEEGIIQTVATHLYEVVQNQLSEELRKNFKEWAVKNFFDQEQKTLDIIEAKQVDMFEIARNENVESYNYEVVLSERLLTEEEFEFLKFRSY